MRQFNTVEALLNWRALLLIVLIGLTPLAFDIGRRYEGVVFPVVKPFIAEDGTEVPIIAVEKGSPEDEAPYVDIYVQFEKVRDCTFLVDYRQVNGETVTINKSLSWYDANGKRLYVEFPESSALLPDSRTLGDQIAGPWRLHGVRTTVDTHAIVAHECHPFWLTHTQFHP